jgi:mannosyltransferase OCH1-like enzyme
MGSVVDIFKKVFSQSNIAKAIILVFILQVLFYAVINPIRNAQQDKVAEQRGTNHHNTPPSIHTIEPNIPQYTKSKTQTTSKDLLARVEETYQPYKKLPYSASEEHAFPASGVNDYREIESSYPVGDGNFYSNQAVTAGPTRIPEIKDQEELLLWEELQHLTNDYQFVFIVECIDEATCQRTANTWAKPEFLSKEAPGVNVQVITYKGKRSDAIVAAFEKFPKATWYYYCQSDAIVYPARLMRRVIINNPASESILLSFPIPNGDAVIRESGFAVSASGMSNLVSCLKSDPTTLDPVTLHNHVTHYPKLLTCKNLAWGPLPGLHPYSQLEVLKMAVNQSIFTSTAYFNESVIKDIYRWETLGRVPISYARMEPEFYDDLFAQITGTFKIPKIMHQMWIGSKPMKPETLTALAECKKIYEARGWKYMWWDEKALRESKVAGEHLLDVYANEMGSFEPKLRISDISRLGILYKYGGFYTDVDAHCLRTTDGLLQVMENTYDGAFCYESERIRGTLVANGVMFGAKASQTMAASIMQYGVNFRQKGHCTPWMCTGPVLVTQVATYWKTWSRLKILPSSTFIPIHPYAGVRTDLVAYGRYKHSYTVQLFNSQ